MAQLNKGRKGTVNNGQRMDALRYAVSQGYGAKGVNVERVVLKDVGGFVFMGVSNIHLKQLPKLSKRDIDLEIAELDIVINLAAKQYETSQKLNNL